MTNPKLCETHFVANCPLCSKKVAPNPTPGQSASGLPNTAYVSTESPATPTPPEPKIQDQKAQAMLDAANKYAAARELAATLERQRDDARELEKTLQTKFEEARKEERQAQREMLSLLQPKEEK